MITLYSNWWIKPGREKKAKEILRKLAKKVKKNEAGTLRYLVHYAMLEFPKKYLDYKSEPKQRPGSVTFIETYKSWAAFDTHFNGKPFQKFLKKHGKLFVQDEVVDGEAKPFIQVVFLDEVAGFDRLGDG